MRSRTRTPEGQSRRTQDTGVGAVRVRNVGFDVRARKRHVPQFEQEVAMILGVARQPHAVLAPPVQLLKLLQRELGRARAREPCQRRA